MTKASPRHLHCGKIPAIFVTAAVLLVMVFGVRSLSAADIRTIAGDPLEISSDEYMNMQVYRNQSGEYIPQYFDTYQTYLRLATGPVQDRTVNVSNSYGSTPYNFTPVSHTLADASTIVTSVNTADLVNITHTVTYTAGAEIYRHEWVVTNNGATTYSDVALRYGGDTYFAGIDDASGYYDSNMGMVYCKNPEISGLMGMFGGPESPATGYYEGLYGEVNLALASAPDLPNTVKIDFEDNGMGLEWKHPTDLAPGQSFTIVAYEKWTEAGAVQVLAPPPFAADPGESLSIEFIITNLQETSDTVELAVTAPVGWQASVVGSLQIAANTNVPVDVAVTVASDAVGIGTVELTLTKRDPQNNNAVIFTHSDHVNVTVRGTTTEVVSPIIPISTAERTVYTAISPSTPEGVDSVLAALSGRPSNVTRAFAWHSYDGLYVELPAESALLPDGVLSETGIFIVTRSPLSYSLSGTPYDASYYPYQLPIPPGTDAVGVPTGWTFAGIPPIKFDSETIQTDFVWPSETVIPQFQPATTLEILANGEPMSDADLIQLMGDPASTDVSTSQPYWWDSAIGQYRQVSTLRSGEAYWFKNNSIDVDITIQVSASQRVILLAASSSGESTPSAQAKKVTHQVSNRGAPPALPGSGSGSGGSGSGSSAKSSSSGGCGAGSGLGLLSVMFLLTMVSLRFLVARR